MRTRRLLAAVMVACAFALAGCDRTAELIPGDSSVLTPTPTTTPAPVQTGPILTTPTIELGPGGGSGTAAIVPDHELARAVVKVTTLAGEDGAGSVVASGSGVVIDTAERLILTSYPLVQPIGMDGGSAYDRIVIGTNRRPGAEPRAEFEAVVVAADPSTDLAVLRAMADAEGAPLEPGTFDLPAVTPAPNAPYAVGDGIRLFGHPDEGAVETASPVAVTQAHVARIRGEADLAGRAWITTDAQLPSGAQGGPAFEPGGGLVGILVQPVYRPALPVTEVRPIELAAAVIERAHDAGPEARYDAPLIARPRDVGGEVWVSRPSFALNATDGASGRELYDYRDRFAPGTGTIYYEFAALGLEPGDVVEERWHREDVLQDQLSSSYPWELGAFGVVADRILTPNPAGLPEGRWRLEVWVNEELRSAATAVIGDERASPTLEPAGFAPFASDTGDPATPASSSDSQILMFFDYEGMQDASQIRWLVFRNGRVVYQSPTVPWTGGNSGRWWVGYRPPGTLGAGTWEFEVQVDGAVAVVDSITLP